MTTDSWYSPKTRRRVSEISPTVALAFDGGQDGGHEIFGCCGAAREFCQRGRGASGVALRRARRCRRAT